MTDDILGGCLCGAVRYRFAGSPLAFYVCHCTDCQKQTGSAFGLSMIVKRDDVELLQGTPGLQLPNHLLLYARTLTYLFALGEQLAPEVDLVKLTTPHLLRFLAARE